MVQGNKFLLCRRPRWHFELRFGLIRWSCLFSVLSNIHLIVVRSGVRIRLIVVRLWCAVGSTPWCTCLLSGQVPPKGPPAPSSAAPPPPRKAPPAGGSVPPRPGAPVYKPPPHGAFVAIIGKDPAGVRVRPPPSNLVHPNHRARRAREDWDRNNPPAGAAPGAPDPKPPPLYRAPQRQVADRPKVVVIFDWFGVLSRPWNSVLRRFSDRFLLAFNRFLFELRPIEVGICSYADTSYSA